MMLCPDSQSVLRFTRRHCPPADSESDMAVKTTVAVCEYYEAVQHDFTDLQMIL